MRMFRCLALIVAVLLPPASLATAQTKPVVAPEFESRASAYRQAVIALRAGRVQAALPGLEFAAKHGHPAALWRLARMYQLGIGVKRDGSLAFHYFRALADRYAELYPGHQNAGYVARAFTELGRYYQTGHEPLDIEPDPEHAARLYLHAASYFGDAEAQYRLAIMYLVGEGLPKSIHMATSWLMNAVKKQNVRAQAKLGDMLWRGQEVRRRPLQGLALLILANEAPLGRKLASIRSRHDRAQAQADPALYGQAVQLAKLWRARISAVSAGDRRFWRAQPSPVDLALPGDISDLREVTPPAAVVGVGGAPTLPPGETRIEPGAPPVEPMLGIESSEMGVNADPRRKMAIGAAASGSGNTEAP